MEASIKFRDDQNPLFKAKVPLIILGFPCQSAVETGDSKELCLSFSSFFQSGPLIKLSYRPNDSWNPFSVGLKTGIGHFGSPVSAPMTMSAEFNLLGNGNPSFFLHFRPQIGDFAIKRTVKSHIAYFKPHAKYVNPGNEDPVGGGEAPSTSRTSETETRNVIFPGDGINGEAAVRAVESAFSGMDLSARTSLPLRDRAVLKLRWSVRFPADEIRNRRMAEMIPFRMMPSLVLNKIGIEHVAVKQNPPGKPDVAVAEAEAEACLAAKKELNVIRVENYLLRKSLEEMKSGIGSENHNSVSGVHDSVEVNRTEKNGRKKDQNREGPLTRVLSVNSEKPIL